MVALCALVVLATGWLPAFAAKRVALVVGNSTYQNTQLQLLNPKNDAQDVGAALKDQGFDVTLATDVDINGFEDALSHFKAGAQDAEIALFFYAGHAVQYDHVNYLIPVDAAIDRPERLKHASIAMDEIVDALHNAAGVQVIILDSCRDNPFASLRIATRGLDLSRGLYRVQVGSGDSVVLYSTRPNEVALDGVDSRNSPFSGALVEQLRMPGRHELGSLLQQVAAKVKSQTNGRQAPELTMSVSGQYFLGADNDRLEWDQVKDSLDPKALRAFAERHPDSTFRREAERRAETYEQEQARRLQDAEQERQRQKRQEEELRMQALCSMGRRLLDLLTTGRDQGGLEQLARDNTCPALQGPIQQAIGDVSSRGRQARCDRLDEEIRRNAAAGDATALDSLRAASAACPGSADRIAQAVQDVRAEAARVAAATEQQRVCDADEGRLATLRNGGAGQIDAVNRLAATSACDRVRDEARAAAVALADESRRVAAALCADEGARLDALAMQGPRAAIEALGRSHQCPSLTVGDALARFDAAALAARQQAACADETGRLDRLAEAGPRSAIEALGQAHACPSLDVRPALARFDDMMEKRRQQALAACAAVDVAALRAGGDVKGLGDLSARCPSRQTDVRQALAAIDTARRQAQACRDETAELQGYVAAGQAAGATALGKRAACPGLDVAAALATIATRACDKDLAGVSRASGTDESALRKFAAEPRLCPAARDLAGQRADALVLARQTDDAACDAAIGDAVGRGDLAELDRLAGDARCLRRREVLASQVSAVRAAERARVAEAKCQADAGKLAALGAGDESALRGFAAAAQLCDRVRAAAGVRIAALETAQAEADQSCDAAVREASGRRDIDALQRLRDDRLCLRRQAAVGAQLVALVAGEHRRIAVAQRKLTQIGCYAGAASGLVDDATRTAVGAYWTVRHADRPTPTTITVDLSLELDGERSPVCRLPTPVPAPPSAALEPVTPTAPAVAKAEPELPQPAPVRPRIQRPAAPKSGADEEAPRKPRFRPAMPRAIARQPERPAPVVARRPPSRPAPAETAEPAADAPRAHVFYN